MPPVRVWGVDSIVKTSLLCSVKVEKHDALVTFDEKSDFTEVYFRTIVPERKQEEAMYALAHFFFRRYNVVSEDNNLLNHLLRAPVEDLATIMLQNNRFPPSDIDYPLALTDERAPDEMEIIDLDLLEDHESGQHHRPFSFPNLSTQYSLRDLVTSIESRSRDVKTSAWNFRISKHFKQISSTREKARLERLQRSLLMEDYISALPTSSTHEALLHPATMGGEGYGSPPELTAHSTSQQVRTREIGFLGELFVRHSDSTFLLISNVML